MGVAVADPADEERVRFALDCTERAVRLLEAAFSFAVGENRLSMPAVERYYAALVQAEASAAALEARLLMRGHRREGPGDPPERADRLT